MKKNKLAVLALTGLITFGSMTNFASASTADVYEDNTEQEVIVSEYYDTADQEDVQISIEEYVNSFTSITDEEKALLIETYTAMEEIFDQIEAIYEGKEELTASEEKEVEGLLDQLDALLEKIEDIEVKMYGDEYLADDTEVVSVEEYVNSLTGITDEEKALLIETYTAMEEIFDQIDAIYEGKEELNASEEKEVEDLFDQLDALYEKVEDILENI